ncbi:hypothetical protein F5B20DRAFT_378794 [Whalleya microplaca]|nr:hypothetical protein F5B20DRAFT_378794 [Whalleya microplaca]
MMSDSTRTISAFEKMGVGVPEKPSSLYQSFETSGLIIQRDAWTIRNPKIEDIADEGCASEFIKNVPPRDIRKNFEESRFRILCIRNQDRRQFAHHKAILQAAHESGWIGGEFETLLQKGSVGSVLLEGSRSISLILQTPNDYMPSLSLSMTELGEDGKNTGLDWVCLVFASGTDLQHLLDDISVPQDFGTLSVDFMFLLVQTLSIQAGRVRDEVTKLIGDDENGDNVATDETDETGETDEDGIHVNSARNQLFEHEKTRLQLQTRSRFVQELADSINKCFDKIAKRHENKRQTIQYSNTLRQRVGAQIILSKMMQPDLDGIPAKIKAQHRMIDAMYNAMMAQMSFESVEQARRDSSSMRAIAVVTLVFLPATFIAAIFSMTMFNWLGGQTESVVSNRLWIFFALSVPLTLIVLLTWRISYKRKEKAFKENQKHFRRRWQV